MSDADPSAPVQQPLEDGRTDGPDPTRWTSRPGRSVATAAVRASRVVGAHGVLLLTLLLGVGIAFLLAFAAAHVYDAVTEADGVARFDRPVLHAAMGLRSPVLDGIAYWIAELFGPVGMPVLAVVGCGVLALRRRSATPVILVVAAGLGSLVMTIAGKDVIGRHRPPLSDAIPPFEYSPSFPSGHTLNAVVICGVLAYLLILRRRSGAARAALVIAAGLTAVFVGLSRVLLGAHWLTDVLAGWLLGGAWLAVVITAHRLYLTSRRRAGTAGALP